MKKAKRTCRAESGCMGFSSGKERVIKIDYAAELAAMRAEADAEARAAGLPVFQTLGVEPYASRAAEAWLSRFLCAGPQPAKEVYAKADANGHTKITIQRAKKALGILSRKSRGRGGAWVWTWPPKAKEGTATAAGESCRATDTALRVAPK